MLIRPSEWEHDGMRDQLAVVTGARGIGRAMARLRARGIAGCVN